MRIAGKLLSHKKVYLHKRRPLSEHLSTLLSHWLLINYYFRLNSKPKINRSPPRYLNISLIISLNTQLVSLAAEYNVSIPALPFSVNLPQIAKFHKTFNTIKQTVQALLKQE